MLGSLLEAGRTVPAAAACASGFVARVPTRVAAGAPLRPGRTASRIMGTARSRRPSSGASGRSLPPIGSQAGVLQIELPRDVRRRGRRGGTFLGTLTRWGLGGNGRAPLSVGHAACRRKWGCARGDTTGRRGSFADRRAAGGGREPGAASSSGVSPRRTDGTTAGKPLHARGGRAPLLALATRARESTGPCYVVRSHDAVHVPGLDAAPSGGSRRGGPGNRRCLACCSARATRVVSFGAALPKNGCREACRGHGEPGASRRRAPAMGRGLKNRPRGSSAGVPIGKRGRQGLEKRRARRYSRLRRAMLATLMPLGQTASHS